MAQQTLVLVLCLAESSEALPVLGNDQEVASCYWERVFDGHTLVVFEQFCAGDLSLYYFVKREVKTTPILLYGKRY